jgi:hypothetical protein
MGHYSPDIHHAEHRFIRYLRDTQKLIAGVQRPCQQAASVGGIIGNIFWYRGKKLSLLIHHIVDTSHHHHHHHV